MIYICMKTRQNIMDTVGCKSAGDIMRIQILVWTKLYEIQMFDCSQWCISN